MNALDNSTQSIALPLGMAQPALQLTPTALPLEGKTHDGSKLGCGSSAGYSSSCISFSHSICQLGSEGTTTPGGDLRRTSPALFPFCLNTDAYNSVSQTAIHQGLRIFFFPVKIQISLGRGNRFHCQLSFVRGQYEVLVKCKGAGVRLPRLEAKTHYSTAV